MNTATHPDPNAIPTSARRLVATRTLLHTNGYPLLWLLWSTGAGRGMREVFRPDTRVFVGVPWRGAMRDLRQEEPNLDVVVSDSGWQWVATPD